MAQSLRIAWTWDGEPVEADETARIRLGLQDSHLQIDIAAPFHGDPAPPAPVGSTWQLWEHEVVELFILGPDEHYIELEFGPFGHFLGLRLQGRRNIVSRALPVSYQAAVEAGRWRGQARLRSDELPGTPRSANAYAIHGVGPERRHLAAYPAPGDAPDFHRLEIFQPLRNLATTL